MTMGIVNGERQAGGSRDGRARLIRGALELLGERGYGETDLRQAATRGAAPRGSIYHHFKGGKAELARAAIDGRAAALAELLEQSLAEQGVLLTLDLFTQALSGPEDREPAQIGCSIAALALAPPEETELHAAAAAAFSRLERIMADALISEGVNSAEAPVVAALVMAAAEGALIRARAFEDRRAIRESLAGLRSLLEPILGSLRSSRHDNHGAHL
jgi:TetR/AcrR family transcriptional repressor of lmrAB and yxaGH operons